MLFVVARNESAVLDGLRNEGDILDGDGPAQDDKFRCYTVVLTILIIAHERLDGDCYCSNTIISDCHDAILQCIKGSLPQPMCSFKRPHGRHVKPKSPTLLN